MKAYPNEEFQSTENILTSWDFFVLRHRDKRNLIVHFISFLVYYFSPVAAIIMRNPWYLVGLPISGAIGAFGHYIFKDGGVNTHEATSSPRVVFYVTIMFYRILRGKYWDDISLALTKQARLRSF
jgi:hypothetical protein